MRREPVRTGAAAGPELDPSLLVSAPTLDAAARAALELAAAAAGAREAQVWLSSIHGHVLALAWDPATGIRPVTHLRMERSQEEIHRRSLAGETVVERDPLRNWVWTSVPVPGPGRALGTLTIGQGPDAADVRSVLRALAAALGLKASHLGTESDLAHERERAAGWFRNMDAQIRILEGERQKLAAVLNRSDASVFVADASGQILWINPVLAARAGVTSPILGTDCQSVCGFADRCTECPVLHVVSRNEPVHREHREVREGEVRHLYVSAYPVRTPEGAVREVLVMTQDLTDLDTVRRSEARYHLLFERSMDAMVTADPVSLEIRSVNRQARLLLGLSGEPGQAKRLPDLHPPEIREAMAERYRALAAGRPLENVEAAVLGPEGHALNCNTCGSLFEVPGSELVLVEYRDVTQLRRLQQELTRADHLITLGTMNAGIAHEFKNRLAPLRAFAQLVTMRPSPEVIARHGTQFMREIDRLAALVRDILDYARPPQPRLRREDLGALGTTVAGELGAEMKEALEASGIRLQSSSAPDLVVDLDADHLHRVLLNLVQNSVDACAQAERPADIEVHAAREGGEVVLTVQDTGCGIEAQALARVFDPFFSTKGPRGSGLGMCIVKSLVEANGGRVAVTSTPGQGTRVEMRFPLASGEKPSPPPEGVAARRAA